MTFSSGDPLSRAPPTPRPSRLEHALLPRPSLRAEQTPTRQETRRPRAHVRPLRGVDRQTFARLRVSRVASRAVAAHGGAARSSVVPPADDVDAASNHPTAFRQGEPGPRATQRQGARANPRLLGRNTAVPDASHSPSQLRQDLHEVRRRVDLAASAEAQAHIITALFRKQSEEASREKRELLVRPRPDRRLSPSFSALAPPRSRSRRLPSPADASARRQRRDHQAQDPNRRADEPAQPPTNLRRAARPPAPVHTHASLRGVRRGWLAATRVFDEPRLFPSVVDADRRAPPVA